MPNIIMQKTPSFQDKISLMREDAAYDIADGDRFARGDYSAETAGENDLAAIGKSISNIKSKLSPPTVPKVFVSNDCSFNCAYCGCRCSKDKRRYTHNAEEIADLALATANECGHGVFITSAICKNADYTEELIIDTLKAIRQKRGYDGYVHAKIMPGTDPLLIRQLGFLADRVSVNIELPHSEGYKILAKQKTRKNILSPMAAVNDFYKEFNPSKGAKARSETGRLFAPAGQTTQMMVGAMGESDRTITVLADSLYKKFDLRRVYYSPFDASGQNGYKTPKWRGRRLYQADRLVKLYGMSPDEILPENSPNLDFDIDPKAAYALRNIGMFPVEINSADYETLLRVPGIGITSAKKIVAARKASLLTFESLKYMRVSLSKSKYFITCRGKYCGQNMLGNPNLRNKLWADEFVFMQNMEQTSLFSADMDMLPIDYDVST
ncbi:MAG: putative DNA modification/repair radical SAM protein [Oscillospiraceae bacterium]|nr:putative DNA modification/repair radical SAM protein [Oscillospiraceae bacterium]